MSRSYLDLKSEILTLSKGNATLVAITKNRTLKDVKALYDLGCRDFGENRVQEAIEKIEAMPSDIRWHLTGPLQSNKINKVIGRFFLIHSVDSVAIAEKISEKSLSHNLRTSILLQINISLEKTKHGFTENQCLEFFTYLQSLKGISICGLMTMAPHEADEKEVLHIFRRLKELREKIRSLTGHSNLLPHLSMGMSRDYKIALEEGSTLVRLGSALFLT